METARIHDPLGLVGSLLGGKYGVEALVDETEFCVVYRAAHRLWRRPVAIKALKAQGLKENLQGPMLEAFVREGALLAELSERCAAICQARDVSSVLTAGGQWVPYTVLEWLEGEPLDVVFARERAEQKAPRTMQDAMVLLDPIATALQLAHEQGIVHRDVKPANIFLLAGGGNTVPCKLLDFGIAKVVSDASNRLDGQGRCFTPAYGAPEQFSPAHGATGPWTDVFALALVMVETITLRVPFEGGGLREYERQSCDRNRRPTPQALGATVAADVERVFERALEVRPSDRYATAGEFWSALQCAAVTPRQTDAARGELDASLAIPLARRRRSRHLTRWVLSGLTMALTGGAFLALQHWPRLLRIVAAVHWQSAGY
jgi:serine/threonine protein kinase